jgi:HSP20 family protein
MNFGKLAPWNWFKKEDEQKVSGLPIRRSESSLEFPLSLHDIEAEFNHLFDSFRQAVRSGHIGSALFMTDWFKPSLDVASDEKEYTVKIELPGIEASNVSIEYSNQTLKIKGEKRQQKEEKEKNYYRVERSYGSFERILDLPEDSDADNITSSYKDGVLNISIPRKMLPKADTKKIDIKTL